MTRITATPMGDLRFAVDVVEDDAAATSYAVTVPRDLLDDLGLADDDAERLVRASFEFLLERERPSQILREFSLDVIGSYFPEYRSEIATRLAV